MHLVCVLALFVIAAKQDLRSHLHIRNFMNDWGETRKLVIMFIKNCSFKIVNLI